MPYENEFANKSSHGDIIRNPDTQEFLNSAEYMKVPSEKEGEAISSMFLEAPNLADTSLQPLVIATDGSLIESTINESLPSTRVGYVKVSMICIQTAEIGGLRDIESGLVDPFKVAQLQRNRETLSFVLPCSNVRWGGCDTVKDSFRKRLDAELLKEETRFDKSDYKTSLRSTLFALNSIRPRSQQEQHKGEPDSEEKMTLSSCPTCREKRIEVYDVIEDQFCPHCKSQVYPSDVLRVWEGVSEFAPNTGALSRLMMAIEHMLPAHYIHNIKQASSLQQLSDMAFIVDGPLAIYGEAAWVGRALQPFYYDINLELRRANLPEITVVGLQKSGALREHFSLINRYVDNNTLLVVNDDYRYNCIVSGREPSATGFGTDTHYGQDFLYKTEAGHQFVIAVPYPFRNKDGGNAFVRGKVEVERYENLPRALNLVDCFQTELYENAVIPVALAHRYTAISLVPGGKVLDIFSRKHFAQY